MRLAPVLLAGMPVAYAQQASTGGLEEIIVTAQKREENLQTVPVSIQAIGTARLEELNVVDFDDYVKYMPSVSYQSFGPGFAQVYMRGVVSGGDGNHSGSLPSVGIYLDEQPITTIQGALDVHLYDVARVEALAGPQGTLYGASSQSGTLRIITNRPDVTGFSAAYGVEANTLSGGDEGYLAEGYVNVPLRDNMAIRLVGWARHDGGYIDNVAGTRTFVGNGITADNSSRAKDDHNDVDTMGGRAALRIDLNDTWTVTPTLMYQKQEANGSFADDPSVGEGKVTHFFPDLTEDTWTQAALAVEGKIGNFDIVYAGSYLDREVDSELDYSDYSYWYDVAYQNYNQELLARYGVDYELNFSSYFYDDAYNPIDFSQYIQGYDGYKRHTHELRVSSPQEDRLRFVAGLFYQKSEHEIEQRYMINDLASVIEVTNWPDTIWLTQQMREDTDSALFGEVSFDFTEKLTATAGARFFKSENSLEGFFGYGAGFSSRTGEAACPDPDGDGPLTGADGPDFNGAPCKNMDRSTDDNDSILKFNLSYRFDDARMVYATYSEGFRPGGINRRGSLPPYEPDFLTNYELGWKTSWANNRLRFNGALFMQKWEDFQYSLLGQNGLTEITNVGSADINGLEMDVAWAVTDRFAITAGASFLDSELTDNYCGFYDENLKPVSSSNCARRDPDTDEVFFSDPEAPEGTQLPVMPEFKGNLTARYEFPVGAMNAHVQGALVYVGDRKSDLRLAERELLGDMPSYTVTDLTAGIGNDNWTLELVVGNVFDERAELSKWTQCSEILTFDLGTTYDKSDDFSTPLCGSQPYVITAPPRTIGLKFSQQF